MNLSHLTLLFLTLFCLGINSPLSFADELNPRFQYDRSDKTKKAGPKLPERVSLRKYDAAAPKVHPSIFRKGEALPKALKPIDQGVSQRDNLVSPFIVGGVDVPPGERSYQISVQDEFGHFCGGALISREWILTAAHCVTGNVVFNTLYAAYGSNDLSSSDNYHMPVVDVFIHPDFDISTLDYDFAMLRLAEPAPQEVPVLPLITPELMLEYAQTGDMAMVSGWGLIDNEGNGTDILQQVDVPLVDAELCSVQYEELGLGVLTEQMLCAGYPEGGKDSCFGDSGGPLTVNIEGVDFSIGVVSWGSFECATADAPGVYAKTVSALDWIEQTQQAISYPVQTFDGFAEVSGQEGDFLLYQFEVPENAMNLSVNLSGGIGDADLLLYSSPYFLTSTERCVSANADNEEQCFLSLAPGATYTIVVAGYTDFEGALLSAYYEPLYVDNGSVFNDIKLGGGQSIELFVDVPEGQKLTVNLSGGEGDADLGVFSIENGEENFNCFSFSDQSNEEQCIIESTFGGGYIIFIPAYRDFYGASLSLSWEEAEQPEPLLPLAVCEHQIIAQLGNYFIATINIFNISDQVLMDWDVSFEYSMTTNISFVLNGILSGRNPYKIQSNLFGRTIAPGSYTSVYLFVSSPSGLAENPHVTGNYCY